MSKYTPETVTFNDGIFDIYACDKYGKKSEKWRIKYEETIKKTDKATAK